MKFPSPQPLMPIVITFVTSLLFFGKYDSVYAINMLTGLTFFFYFAGCVRRTAHTLQTKKIHHYAIPLSVLQLYTPSIITIILLSILHTSFTPSKFFMGIALPTLNAVMLWGLIWGVSKFINQKIANNKIFTPGINYGLNLFILCTPIFYPLNAVRIELIRMIISYNPLAIAIITTRAILLGNAGAIPPATAAYALIVIFILDSLGYAYSRLHE